MKDSNCDWKQEAVSARAIKNIKASEAPKLDAFYIK